MHAPWDYLGGYLVCLEAGAHVVDIQDRELATGDPNAAPPPGRGRHPRAARRIAQGRRVTDLDVAGLARLAEAAARAGGEVVRRGFSDPGNVREKSPGDWVSDVDVTSERTIAAALAEGAPDIPFFGEESGGERGPLGWICDPLDGTANFLHGFPAVGVSIGLVARRRADRRGRARTPARRHLRRDRGRGRVP